MSELEIIVAVMDKVWYVQRRRNERSLRERVDMSRSLGGVGKGFRVDHVGIGREFCS